MPASLASSTVLMPLAPLAVRSVSPERGTNEPPRHKEHQEKQDFYPLGVLAVNPVSFVPLVAWW
jgi:hypothetical protein